MTFMLALACADDGSPATPPSTSADETGDGDPGDGDGDPGDGDGDGDGDSGDGDGDSGDGDSGDGDGDGGCQLADLLDQATWDQMFLHKDDPACAGANYTLPGLLEAAAAYPSFACEGDLATRQRELAAFLAQISHETTGGWPAAPDGPYAWGLCFIEEVGCENNGCPQYCDANNMQYPCAPGRTYHGRGAIQLSWNYNYGQAGDALGVDILANPDLVASDPKLATQTALWFWMTEQLPKPSAHAVMVGSWMPSAQDLALGRLPGFGMTTNIINGGLECNMPGNAKVEDRVGFFMRYAELLGTDVGEAVDCDMMTPYG
ncbi:Dipeptide-binding ABC transporter, periplasmic substrate-binding component [Enhygromyxa salina]|uniref:Dipeptide-binding ABC transporter, periplasmic substrate-binding component n=1 Tax=Enhygromyxa salina TaxID=215803 RepID=A0A0C1ZRV2_9BACT|nr:Dipeptide-binding ABC transporter, periplasmic substrate-binding component [Enhygromyxa salina]